ncbi:hypothetical protein C7451_112115 [Blastomonas natatoria]|uniref:Uncharacterized protein n=1 Tax=Blastomonas natatoria TaxID=34015 RepID=A0A2V3UX24_9SPHN|nr:hypothetical protein [Blastomonas natatoria]PXW71671.1 hypothetical protein C7451_112115 [Blastomonas natatoria]
MDGPSEQPPSEGSGNHQRSERSDGVVAIRLSWLQLCLLTFGFVVLVAGEIAVYDYLSGRTGWPDAYGIECRRRCWPVYLLNSPRLLLNGGVDEIALFAAIWALIIIPALILIPLGKKLRAARRSG